MDVWLRSIVILCWFCLLNVANATVNEYLSNRECGAQSVTLYNSQGDLETCEAAARNEANCYGYFQFKSNGGQCQCCDENTQDTGGSSQSYTIYKYIDTMYVSLESEGDSDYVEVTLDYDIEEVEVAEVYSNTSQIFNSNWGYTESKLWVTDELYAKFYVTFITASISVSNPKDSSSFKPGDTVSIKWAYYQSSSTNAIAVYLYKSSDRVQVLDSYVSLSSAGSFNTSVVMPSLDAGMADGTDYRVKIVDPSDSSVYGYSSYFTISSGILFSDDLCDDDSTLWTELTGTWERTDCTYKQTDQKEMSYAWIGDSITPASWSDYSVVWTMTLHPSCKKNGKVGVLVRSKGVTGKFKAGTQYFIGIGSVTDSDTQTTSSNVYLRRYGGPPEVRTLKVQTINDNIDITAQTIKGTVTVEGRAITVNIAFDGIDESYSFTRTDGIDDWESLGFDTGVLGLFTYYCPVAFESLTVYDDTWNHYEILVNSEYSGAQQASCISLVHTLIVLVATFLMSA